MTVAELRKKLKTVPQDAIVLYFNGDECMGYATHVSIHPHTRLAWRGSDYDMAEVTPYTWVEIAGDI